MTCELCLGTGVLQASYSVYVHPGEPCPKCVRGLVMPGIDCGDPAWQLRVKVMREHYLEDLPRLEFCEWFEERYGSGHPLPAFVRGSIEAQRRCPGVRFTADGWRTVATEGLNIGPYQSLAQETYQHLKASWLTWVPGFKAADGNSPVLDVTWRRGFPDEVTCGWMTWELCWEDLAALGPIGRVTLITRPTVAREHRAVTQRFAFRLANANLREKLREPEYLTAYIGDAVPSNRVLTDTADAITRDWLEELFLKPGYVQSIRVSKNPYEDVQMAQRRIGHTITASRPSSPRGTASPPAPRSPGAGHTPGAGPG